MYNEIIDDLIETKKLETSECLSVHKVGFISFYCARNEAKYFNSRLRAENEVNDVQKGASIITQTR